MAEVRVANESEIPRDRGLCVRVGRVEIGLYRVGGEVFAMENACPHAGYPLHEGELDGPVVTCPQHLWQFDVRTGRGPGESDGWPIPCFPARVDGGEVWIDVPLPHEDET